MRLAALGFCFLSCSSAPPPQPAPLPPEPPAPLVPTPAEPAAQPPVPEVESAPARPPHESDASERSPRVLATSRPQPCVFAGTVQLDGAPLVRDAAQRSSALSVDRLDVARLELPATAQRATHVEALWPLRGSYFILPGQQALELVSKQELVAEHVWLPPGTPVSAAEPQRGRARVRRLAALPPGRGSTPSFDRVLECETLALRGSYSEGEVTESELPMQELSGSVPLRAAPRGKIIARIELTTPMVFTLLETQPDGWIRIAGQPWEEAMPGVWSYLPFAFDAWTNAASHEGEASSIGGLGLSSRVTHRTTGLLRIFEHPGAREPLAVLASDVAIGVKDAPSGIVSVEGGYLPVAIEGVHPLEGREFWLLQRELAESALPLDGERAAELRAAPAP